VSYIRYELSFNHAIAERLFKERHLREEADMKGIVLSRRLMATTSALALMAALAMPSLAWAEAPGGDTSGAAEDQIPEVTVTARKRTESLQEVPVAVSVVSSEEAKQFNLNDLQDLLGTVPSANFKAEGSNKDRTIVVRGIGTFSTAQSVEPSVSTVVDGVVMARSGQADRRGPCSARMRRRAPSTSPPRTRRRRSMSG
jgi:outer membrane receptor protein involved in Fe transport